jgi:hypothetical protein
MTTTFTTQDVDSFVREVTDEEVAFYIEHGWVKLPGLVAPELAAELLRVGRTLSDPNWVAAQPDAEPFRAFVYGDVMARSAVRLMNRKRLSGVDVPLRAGADHFVSKPPGSRGAPYHQDSAEHGTDRVGEMQFWLALADVTPEMGPMRFIDRCHKEGPLGSVFNEDGGGDLLDLYPKLVDRLTEPIEYEVGDATVHAAYTGHGSAPNTSDRPRLSYIFNYMPADCRWWNGTSTNWGSERKKLDDERNPIIYPLPEATT